MGTLKVNRSDLKTSYGKGARRVISTSQVGRKRPTKGLITTKTAKNDGLGLISPNNKLLIEQGKTIDDRESNQTLLDSPKSDIQCEFDSPKRKANIHHTTPDLVQERISQSHQNMRFHNVAKFIKDNSLGKRAGLKAAICQNRDELSRTTALETMSPMSDIASWQNGVLTPQAGNKGPRKPKTSTISLSFKNVLS